MRVAIIGAGLQGRRRAPVLTDFSDTKLTMVTAARLETAQLLAEKMNCEAGQGWETAVRRDDIDAVVVCTPPDSHARISIAAMEHGKHVLCEKPLARTVDEAEAMLRTARASPVRLKCGFNHRHHPAIQRARKLMQEGAIGAPLFLRSRYGICGRPGYEQEWRADTRVVSGGQLMEQGIHVIDLFRWFVGDIQEVSAFTATSHWQMQPLEDNAFVLLRAATGVMASLHSSLTQWKNLFSFEVFGEDGYLIVEGLGGGYGTETLRRGKRAFGEPFQDEVVEFRGGDVSWHEEWKEFAAAIRDGREPLGNGVDGLEALKVVFAAYESAKRREVVSCQEIGRQAKDVLQAQSARSAE
ncbi:MAG TPA: Gfo/Idh/MocA family oxidoreductase [Candidatus Acidoferrales bacterium]